MSGIAAAKKRRAGVTVSMPTPDAPRLPNGGIASIQQPSQQSQGLTLPQVIALFDSRINKVEKFMNDGLVSNQGIGNSREIETLPSNISEILDDFQEKFVILAGEINSLKDTVLKLQTYTMDVNKILLEERIQILSDIGENTDDRFILENEKTQSFDDSSNTSEIMNTCNDDTFDSTINNYLEQN
jgi:hypothetical protein